MSPFRPVTAPILRAASSADLPVLLALEALFPGDRLSLRQLRHHVFNPNAILRVADAGSALAGYSLLLTRHDSRKARLYSIAVAPAFRGRGLGRQLLLDCAEQARARNCIALRLEVRTDNAAAIALYESVGFNLFGRRPHYYDDGSDALRFQMDLG